MTESDWNQVLLQLPNPHLLQTSEWGELKSIYGWKAQEKIWRGPDGKVNAAAQILKRTMHLPVLGLQLSVLYCPRGPILDWTDHDLVKKVMADLEILAKKEHAIFIKIDAEIPLGTGIPGSASEGKDATGSHIMDLMKRHGWKYSPEQIQFKNTMWIDLSGNEDDWLKRMKQKTRYNLRLAQKNGVKVREATRNELSLLYKMYAETSVRDGFVIREEGYYLDVWSRFMDAGKAIPLMAEVDDEPVAGLILFTFGQRAWYLYGMSTQHHREKMPNYLLQWEAMRRAKAAGCVLYDLWGAPDEFNDSDSMYGVFRFKEGLGGRVIRTAGAWDLPVKPVLYRLYMHVLPRILSIMRKNRKEQTRQEVL